MMKSPQHQVVNGLENEFQKVCRWFHPTHACVSCQFVFIMYMNLYVHKCTSQLTNWPLRISISDDGWHVQLEQQRDQDIGLGLVQRRESG